MATTAVLRFGARASARVPFVAGGSSVTAWCDVTDTLTGAAATVTGVSFRWLSPSGVEFRADGEAEAAGTWRSTLALDEAGDWRLRVETTPGGMLAEAVVTVADSDFAEDGEAAPLLVTPDGSYLVVTSDGSTVGL
jgi:hypothetical protein